MTVREFYNELEFMFKNRRKKEYNGVFEIYKKVYDPDKKHNNYYVFENVLHFKQY